MANTKVTSAVIADNAVGIDQLNVSDGTNGQVLTTNGSGTLSFSTISGYTDSDVETYLDTGTSTPTFSSATVTSTINIDSAASAGLVLDRASSSYGSTVDFKTGGTLKWYMGLRGLANDNFYVRNEAGSTDALTINTSGDVGIGTTPNSYLHVYRASTGSAHVNTIKLEVDTSGWSASTNYLKSIVWNDGAANVGGIGMTYDGSLTNMHFHSFFNGSYATNTSNRIFSIKGNGKVGILDDTPSHTLEVNCSTNYEGVHIRGSQAPCLTWAQNTSSTPSWRAGISGYAGDSFAISTGASVGDVVHVKPTGEFLLNRTGIFGSSGGASMIVTGRNASCAYWTAPNTANYDIHTFFNGGLGVIGTIKQNSSLNGVSYNTSSDYRLKENVTYDWDATTRLKQLKPCRFNWISDETNTLEDGFLAHEVATAVPNAVTGEKDAMTAAVLYEETDQKVIDGEVQAGDIKEEEKINPQQLDHSKLVPLLVKTIQELEARITELENA